MRSAIFVLSVLVVIANAAPPAGPSRTVETELDLEYSRSSEYDRKYEVVDERSPEYFDDDDDDDGYKVKESAPKYEKVTEYTIEYDHNVSYDKAKKSKRSKRSVCKDC